LVLEHENKCEFLDIPYLIMNSEEYQLIRKYKEKFGRICKLAARIIIIYNKMALLVAYIHILTYTIIAYFDSEMNYSVIIMSIWHIILVLSIYYLFSLFLITCTYGCLIGLYIKYRFRQVQKLVEIYLKRGNYFRKILKLIVLIYDCLLRKLNNCINVTSKYIALLT